MLILGYGNADRGDDAAGLLVVRRLRESGIPAEEFDGDGAALIERWAAVEEVMVIDAVRTGRRPGTVAVWRAPSCNPDTSGFRSTHGFGVGEALRLGAALGRLPRRLWICGIEGARFDLGSPPSLQVMAAVDNVVRELQELFKPQKTVQVAQ